MSMTGQQKEEIRRIVEAEVARQLEPIIQRLEKLEQESKNAMGKDDLLREARARGMRG